jgi:hypothetical protein
MSLGLLVIGVGDDPKFQSNLSKAVKEFRLLIGCNPENGVELLLVPVNELVGNGGFAHSSRTTERVRIQRRNHFAKGSTRVIVWFLYRV